MLIRKSLNPRIAKKSSPNLLWVVGEQEDPLYVAVVYFVPLSSADSTEQWEVTGRATSRFSNVARQGSHYGIGIAELGHYPTSYGRERTTNFGWLRSGAVQTQK